MQAVDVAAGEPEQRGQQRERGGDHHRDDDGGGEAELGHVGDPGDGQAADRDDDGAAGEEHGLAGGAVGRPTDSVDVHPGGEVLAVAGEDEQRVVDADAEPDHRRERGRDRADVGHRRHAA